MADGRSIAEVLESVADVLYPHLGNEATVEINSRSSDGDTPLHVLAWRGDYSGAESLLRAGADVNAIGDMGYTPLHVAIRERNLRIAELLLKGGGDLDARSEFGSTPREEAMNLGGEFADLLPRYGRKD